MFAYTLATNFYKHKILSYPLINLVYHIKKIHSSEVNVTFSLDTDLYIHYDWMERNLVTVDNLNEGNRC